MKPRLAISRPMTAAELMLDWRTQLEKAVDAFARLRQAQADLDAATARLDAVCAAHRQAVAREKQGRMAA